MRVWIGGLIVDARGGHVERRQGGCHEEAAKERSRSRSPHAILREKLFAKTTYVV